MGLLKKMEMSLALDWTSSQEEKNPKRKADAVTAYKIKYRAYLNHKAFLKLMAVK